MVNQHRRRLCRSPPLNRGGCQHRLTLTMGSRTRIRKRIPMQCRCTIKVLLNRITWLEIDLRRTGRLFRRRLRYDRRIATRGLKNRRGCKYHCHCCQHYHRLRLVHRHRLHCPGMWRRNVSPTTIKPLELLLVPVLLLVMRRGGG